MERRLPPIAPPRVPDSLEFTPVNFPIAFTLDPVEQIRQSDHLGIDQIQSNHWYMVIMNNSNLYMVFVYKKVDDVISFAITWVRHLGEWRPTIQYKQLTEGRLLRTALFYELKSGDIAQPKPAEGPFPGGARKTRRRRRTFRKYRRLTRQRKH